MREAVPAGRATFSLEDNSRRGRRRECEGGKVPDARVGYSLAGGLAWGLVSPGWLGSKLRVIQMRNLFSTKGSKS